MKNWQLLVLAVIVIIIAVSSFLLFSLWVQPGDSIKVKHFNHNLYISKCKGNHTGIQHTEGNVTTNTTKAICK